MRSVGGGAERIMSQLHKVCVPGLRDNTQALGQIQEAHGCHYNLMVMFPAPN